MEAPATLREPKPDAEYVDEARRGSSAAYGHLVHRWTSRVLAICRGRVPNRELAEDLTQEALLRGWRALDSLEDPGRFGPWLRGIAARICLDWQKTRKRDPVRLAGHAHEGGVELVDPAPDADHELVRDEDAAALMRAVSELSPPLRETLLLFYDDDMSYKEIADLLEVSVATVNARLTKARALLRVKLATSRDGLPKR